MSSTMQADMGKVVAARVFTWVTLHHFPPWPRDSEIQWQFACCQCSIGTLCLAHTNTIICIYMHMFANVDSIKSICSKCQLPSRCKESEPFHSIPRARKKCQGCSVLLRFNTFRRGMKRLKGWHDAKYCNILHHSTFVLQQVLNQNLRIFRIWGRG